ncbi:MAG: O-antigen ligase family protein [Anaerolineae bacterium]
MAEQFKTLPRWLAYADLAMVACAGALWYVRPQVGPWPLVLALAPWGIRYVLTGRLTHRTQFDAPFLIFLLTAGLGVWSAFDRQIAWSKFWLLVGAVLLCYALANAQILGQVRAWLLVLVGVGAAALFLISNDWDVQGAKLELVASLGRTLQASLPALQAFRLNANVAAGLMATVAPYAGWATVHGWRGIRRRSESQGMRPWLVFGLGLSALALILFGLGMAASRGAWLALAGALLLAGVWGVSGRLSQGQRGKRAWMLIALLLAVAAALSAGVLVWTGSLQAALGLLQGPEAGLDRLGLWRNSLVLVRDYPFVGAGLGSFPLLYSTYALLIHVAAMTHSHNLYISVVVEQGIFGLLALVWMWLLFGRAAWHKLSEPGTGSENGVLAAAVLSLTTILIHGTIDDVLYSSGGALLLFTPLAFAAARPSERRAAARRWLAWGLPVAVLLLVVLALLWRGPLLSLVFSNCGAVQQSQAELGVYSWPEWPIQDAVRREVDLSPAVASYERALVLDPHNATGNRRLGMIELSLGEYEDAAEHLKAAYASEPWSETTRQLYGEALITAGQVVEGQALWSRVVGGQDQLRARIFWYKYIGDEKRAAWVRQAAGDR